MVEESLVDLTEAKILRDEHNFRKAMETTDKIEKDLEKKWELGDIEEFLYLLEILRIENFRISVLFKMLIEKKAKRGE